MAFMDFALRTAAVGALALSAVTADAAVNLELGLAIDGSGSISLAEFNLQKNAYASVLADATVLPLDGSVAIGVYLFASSVQTVFPMQVIDGTTITSLITSINGMVRPGGSTTIAGAINTATADIFGNSIVSTRQLIDVSTDGVNNVGNLDLAKSNALLAGIDQINCIGIGAGANCAPVIAGTGAFSLQADNFDDFEAALRKKIRREVTGVVPEPGTWAMMIAGFGLVGGAMRRRRVSAAVA